MSEAFDREQVRVTCPSCHGAVVTRFGRLRLGEPIGCAHCVIAFSVDPAPTAHGLARMDARLGAAWKAMREG